MVDCFGGLGRFWSANGGKGSRPRGQWLDHVEVLVVVRNKDCFFHYVGEVPRPARAERGSEHARDSQLESVLHLHERRERGLSGGRLLKRERWRYL